MPVLGLIFLRHASNRYEKALAQIRADQASGKMPKRPLVKGDFIKRRALLLPENARYCHLLKLPSGISLGASLVEAMNVIEEEFEPLRGQLPKEYARPLFLQINSLIETNQKLRTARDLLLPKLMSGEISV
jgi:type I restriction enzyme M protein